MSQGLASQRAIGLAVLIVAGGVAVSALWPHLVGSVANPETEVITSLKETESDGLTLALPSGPPLVSSKHHFDRIVVQLPETGGPRVRAVSTLDFDGKTGEVEVSSLGLERTDFVHDAGGWHPKDGYAPTLAAAVAALEARVGALQSGDLVALETLSVPGERERLAASSDLAALLKVQHRRYSVSKWYLRSEREGVTVRERYRLEGDLPDRPVDVEGERRLQLVWKDGRLLFQGGVL